MFDNEQETVTPIKDADNTDTSTDLIPLDLDSVKFSDLALQSTSAISRNMQIRAVCVLALDKEWDNLVSLLKPDGGYAGSANMAHAIIADRVLRAEQEAFKKIGGVKLNHIWRLIHEEFKKRGVVFKGGFIIGLKPPRS